MLHNLLLENVAFYQNLRPQAQSSFVSRINNFLEHVKIRNVDKTKVKELDRALIGASAIIPIFHFPEWQYRNLSEVLIFNDSFNFNFDTNGPERNILGMVGHGALHHTMLISQRALRAGFKKDATTNTSIHEFIHLIDMADGAVDGVPEHLIPKNMVAPWLQELYATMKEIENDEVAIRKYAAVNEAEFLSVVSEYFFLRPQHLKNENPELFHLLEKIYNNKF